MCQREIYRILKLNKHRAFSASEIGLLADVNESTANRNLAALSRCGMARRERAYGGPSQHVRWRWTYNDDEMRL